MGLITRFYGPNAKGSKLTIKEMDDNLYYLQSFGVSGVTYQNNVLTFTNPTGGTNSITINDFYTTGATYNNGLIYFDRNDQLSAYTVNISSITGNTNSFTGGTVNGPTNFTNGLTANILSATTYQNLPQDIFVTGGTYTNGELFFKNNSGGAFTVTGLPIGGAGGEVYYLNLSQTQTPYQEFSPIGTNLIGVTTGVTINSGATSTIASFLTPVGYPNTITIPAGFWSFYLHSYKDTINASFNVFCEVYVYTTGGTETLILTTAPTEVTTYDPTTSMGLTDGYYSGTTIGITDRILVKVRTTNTGSQTNTITFFTEGQQNYSYGITPFSNFNALRCDTLSGCTTIINLENNKVNKNGDTMTGTLILPTISATTYQNLPVDPDTYVTGFTYSNNKFTIKQNNGQSNLSQIINTVTGFTVNGGLTTTTATVTNRTGTPSQVASFDTSGKLVAGVGTLGQTTYSAYGTSTLTMTSATVGYQLIPGLTQTITVPNNCSVYVFTSGGMQNSNGSNNSFTVDIALWVDGVGPLSNGSFRRITTTNPNTVNSGWTSALWSMGALLNLSAGNHTIDVRALFRNTSAGVSMTGLISSDLTLNRQGELYIMIIKN